MYWTTGDGVRLGASPVLAGLTIAASAADKVVGPSF